MGLMGKGLQRIAKPERTYVVIPSSKLEAQAAVSKILKTLWAEKVLFGVWQENELHTIPLTTKAIICPWPLSQDSVGLIKNLQARGVKILNGEDDFKSHKLIEKAVLDNGEKIDLLCRRTIVGTLFTLVSIKHTGPVTLKYGNSAASIGLSNFGLIHITDKGVVLLEGEGSFIIDKSLFCKVSKGRLIIASEDDDNMLYSKRLKLMATNPTRISFGRTIAAIELSDGFKSKPQAANIKATSGSELIVDDQMIRYVIHVLFG